MYGYTTSDCSGTGTLFGTTTDGTGTKNWSATYYPSAGTWYLGVSAGAHGNAAKACQDQSFTVDQAGTSTTSSPDVVSVPEGVQFHVDYTVSSTIGVNLNHTGGSVSATGDTTSLGCGGPYTISATQSAGGFTYTADGSTHQTNRIACTPASGSGGQTYSVGASYSGDTNYMGSSSDQSPVAVTTPITIIVCPAAPSIAAHWLKSNGYKSGSPKNTNIVSQIARDMGPGATFPNYSSTGTLIDSTMFDACNNSASYATSVANETQYLAKNPTAKQ